jgi:hypothetical protein
MPLRLWVDTLRTRPIINEDIPMKLRALAPFSAVILLALAGCSADSDSEKATSPSPEESTSTSPTPSASETESASPAPTPSAPVASPSAVPEAEPTSADDVTADAAPVPGTSATDPASLLEQNIEAAQGSSVELRASSAGPATVSWSSSLGDYEETFVGDWSATVESPGQDIWMVNVMPEDSEGLVSCEVLVDDVSVDSDSTDTMAWCMQSPETFVQDR